MFVCRHCFGYFSKLTFKFALKSNRMETNIWTLEIIDFKNESTVKNVVELFPKNL